MDNKQMTLAQHAEAWMQETGHTIPAWGTKEWTRSYEEWIEYAFAGVTV